MEPVEIFTARLAVRAVTEQVVGNFLFELLVFLSRQRTPNGGRKPRAIGRDLRCLLGFEVIRDDGEEAKDGLVRNTLLPAFDA